MTGGEERPHHTIPPTRVMLGGGNSHGGRQGPLRNGVRVGVGKYSYGVRREAACNTSQHTEKAVHLTQQKCGSIELKTMSRRKNTGGEGGNKHPPSARL